MEESQTYFVRRRGQTEGPWDLGKLKSEIGLQKLGRHHEVSTNGVDWQRAGDVAGLFNSEVKKKTLGRTDSAIATTAIPVSPQGPATATSAEWYYSGSSDQQLGPVSMLQLIDTIMTGQTHLDTLVWRDGFGDWLPIEDVPEIMAVLNASGPDGGSNTAATQFVSVEPMSERSTMAIFATVAGLGSLLLSWVPLIGFAGIIAITLGAWAIFEIRRSGGQKTGVALAWLGIGAGALSVFLAFLILIGLAAAIFMS